MFNITLASIIEAILLVCALSMDALVASFAYGSSKIKIPFKSVTVINVICSSILGVSLFVGALLKPYLPETLTTIICFIILLILGMMRLFESTIKNWLRHSTSNSQNVSFKFLDFNFILRVYADSTEADWDHSRILSPTEAATLAIALSLDGLAVGFGAGLTDTHYIMVILFSLISDMVAVMLGCFIGSKVAEKINLNLSWISGLMLIALAFMKLL